MAIGNMDKALLFFSKNQKRYINHAMLKEECFDNSSDINVEAIVNRLRKDDFIHHGGLANPDVYKISVDGEIFFAQGGYQGDINKRAADAVRLRNVEAHQIKNQNQIMWLTLIVAIGTSIAAIYYGIEIWNFITKCKC